MATPRTPKIGSLFAHRYRIECELGRGAAGVVFGVRDEKTQVACALKVLNRPEMRVDAARVIREARALMLISNPHVVRVFDVDERPGYGPYLILERLHGAPLSDLSPLGSPLPQARAIDYAIQICDALAQAHAAGIIHRDIKLSNLFVAREPNGTEVLKVLDFGIAKVAGNPNQLPSVLTKEELLGSPQYMSPEQIIGPHTVDARTDLWSVGVVLFRLLTGRFPFGGESVGDVSSAVLKEPVPRIAAMGVFVSPGLQAVVDRCLERSIEARWPSALDLAAALRALALGTKDVAMVSPVPGGRRRRIAIAVGLVVALVALAVAARIWARLRP